MHVAQPMKQIDVLQRMPYRRMKVLNEVWLFHKCHLSVL